MKNKDEYGSSIYIKRKDIDHDFTEKKEETPKERKGVSFQKIIKERYDRKIHTKMVK